jgi:hypothetical protein
MDETTFVSREDTEKMLMKIEQESDVPEPQEEEEARVRRRSSWC